MATYTELLNLKKPDQTDAAQISDINGNMDLIDAAIKNIWERVYPVGSIYMSVTNTNPGTLFGGTWARIKDRFLLGVGDTYGSVTTGGSATKNIAVANLPAHNHGLNSHKHSIPAHSHGLNSHTHTVTAHTHTLADHTHNVPAHSHGLNEHTHSTPAHTHTLGSHTHTVSTHTHSVSMANSQFKGSDDQAAEFWGTSISSGSSWYVLALGSGGYTGLKGSTTTGSGGGGNTGAATGNTGSGGSGTTGKASGSTASSSAFATTAAGAGSTGSAGGGNTGAASGSTANSAVLETGASTGSTSNTGSGTALDIMPPYQTVYMWKRTA